VKRSMLAVPFLFILCGRSAAQTQAQPLPSSVNAQVDKIFEKWDKSDSPGCALGVYKDGQIIYKRGYGMANLNDDVPITPATVFHVASMSKQFTAASIVLLAQQGKLSLDDDVRKYIPELPDFGERITIRHLVHHTSGLRDQWSLLGLAGWRYSLDLITDDDVMSVMTRQKDLNFKPGEKHVYCNTGYTLMGLIVKRVSGMSLREFTTKNIFEPLGMTHTHFRDNHAEIVKHNALGYEQDGKDKPLRLSVTNFDTVGATSLHTTVEDLQLWDENFYHPRVGGPAFLHQMLKRGKLNSGEQLDYAFGLVVGKYKGLQTVDHAGGDAGYRSDMTRFPEQHFSAAVLCNSADTNPTALVRQVADIFLAKDLKTPEAAAAKQTAKSNGAPLSGEQMAAIAGIYWNREDDGFEKIDVKDGKLQINLGGEEVHALKPAGETSFHVADVPWGDQVEIRFPPVSAGQPRRLEQSFGGEKPDVFESTTAFAPSGTELGEYVGAYVSEEIDPVYRIMLQDGNLSLTRLKRKAETLRPAVRDVFTGDIGTIRFTRDSRQRISGFVLNAGRIRNFRFEKRVFAADLKPDVAAFIADSQVPWGVEALNGTISEPAWKTKPRWYLVSTEDKMIPRRPTGYAQTRRLNGCRG
jgi:CubicO group peptidase (beta-lactamase class C family)